MLRARHIIGHHACSSSALPGPCCIMQGRPELQDQACRQRVLVRHRREGRQGLCHPRQGHQGQLRGRLVSFYVVFTRQGFLSGWHFATPVYHGVVNNPTHAVCATCPAPAVTFSPARSLTRSLLARLLLAVLLMALTLR